MRKESRYCDDDGFSIFRGAKEYAGKNASRAKTLSLIQSRIKQKKTKKIYIYLYGHL